MRAGLLAYDAVFSALFPLVEPCVRHTDAFFKGLVKNAGGDAKGHRDM